MVVIKRKLFSQLQSHLNEKEITLIIGPRQAGKTTLMRQLEQDLKKNGEKTIFLNLDRDQDRPFFSSQTRLLQRIKFDIGEQKSYVFIDEIQRKEDAGLFLKGLYDMDLPYKFIVSGSGSLELKEKIHESLAGRKRMFELSTLSFEEFVHFRTGYQHTHKDGTFRNLAEIFDVYKETYIHYFEEYLNFGGYPKVVLESEISRKQVAIDEIYRSYLEKDIVVLLRIQKTESLTQLVRILASQVGNLVNISELSNTLGLAMQTIKDYLWYLEKTFIIRKVTPHFRNIRKEITKAATYYFVDLGLRNYAINQFGNALTIPTQGFLFENFVYKALKEGIYLSPTTIHFWRSKDKAEVDFVINAGLNIVPVEVKFTKLKKAETTRSFKSFLTKYHPSIGYVVHLGERFEEKFENTRVFFIPYYEAAHITQDV